MKKELNKRLYYLDGLRLVAIVFVIGVHVLGYVELDGALLKIITKIILPIAVPVFFLTDGFLFFSRIDSQKKAGFSYAAYVLSSAKRLLIPWAIFSGVFLALRYAFERIGLASDFLVVGQSVSKVALAVYTSQIAPQLYFLVSLFGVRLLALFFALGPRLSLPVLGIIWLGYALVFRIVEPTLKGVFHVGLDPVLHAFWGMQFFLLGSVLYRCHHWLLRKVLVLGGMSLVLTGVLYVAFPGFGPVSAVAQFLYICGGFWVAQGLLNQKSFLTALGRHTMGIYLIHAPVLIKVVAMVVLKFIGAGLVSFFIVVTVVFFVSLGGSVLVWKQKRLHFLFGMFPKKV